MGKNSIGYAAHIAGALAGLLLGLNILRNVHVKQWEKKVWWASIIIYLILMLGAIVWNIFYTDYFPRPDNHWQGQCETQGVSWSHPHEMPFYYSYIFVVIIKLN